MASAGFPRLAKPVLGWSPTRARLLALGLAASAAAVMSAAFALTSDRIDQPAAHVALHNWVTLTYVVAGLVAWLRRPDSRLGVLMIATGFAIFLAGLSSANQAVPYTIGAAFDLLPAVLFLHVFLAFPSGRLETRLERALVITGYAVALGMQLVAMALGDLGPDDLFELPSAPEAATWLLRGQLIALTALCLGALAIVVVRRRRGLSRRRAVLVDSFGVGLAAIAVLFSSLALGIVDEARLEVVRRLAFFVVGLAPLAFLAALLRSRLARSAVGDLFVELRATPDPGALRDALARVLGDPSLTLLLWLPEFESWADVHGLPVTLEETSAARATTLIDRDGAHLAALTHDASLDDEPELLEAVAAAAGMALENAQLHAESRARLDELRASRERIVAAGDAERRRLERNLHDGAQQRLVSVALQLRLVQRRIHHDPASAEQLVAAARNELDLSLQELRALARGLHPAALEHGLEVALDALAGRSPVPMTVNCALARRLPEPVELALYFVACEALANVVKYARATAVTVRVWDGAGIEVADDGVGGADAALGSGLRGLTVRVEALNGRLRVVSQAGEGTKVRAELPCGS